MMKKIIMKGIMAGLCLIMTLSVSSPALAQVNFFMNENSMPPFGEYLPEPYVKRLNVNLYQPELYRPLCTLSPLVSQPDYSNFSVKGPVIFFDDSTQTILKLDGVEFYHNLYDEREGVLYGYALHNADGKAAIMSPSGDMLSDYLYYPVADRNKGASNWQVRNGYAVFADGVVGGWQNLGVLDLRTGEKIVNPLYDDIWLSLDFMIARIDDTYEILSYDGKSLFISGSFPKTELAIQGWINWPDTEQPLEQLEQSRFYQSDEGDVVFILEKYKGLSSANDDMLYYGQNMAINLQEKYKNYDYGHNWLFVAINEDVIDIYYPNFGEPILLMDNVFGYVRSFYNGSRIVVYIDEKTCGFLYKDGNFELIPIDFTVKRYIPYTS